MSSPDNPAEVLLQTLCSISESQSYLVLLTSDLSLFIYAMLLPRCPQRGSIVGVTPRVYRDPPIGENRPVSITVQLLVG